MANALSESTSPYLLRHAHQAVNWFPWAEEALKKAVSEQKPILLSIGYTACHWCHVMASESFEDPRITQYLNEHFISIKVDREERPDVDAFYMKALIAMKGQGGWPLNVFLTPDLKPFLGGSYFPLKGGDNRPGFLDVLKAASDSFQNRSEATAEYAESIMKQTAQSRIKKGGSGSRESVLKGAWKDALAVLEENYDSEYGGFGFGMKFPESSVYQFLLRCWLKTGSKETLEMLDKSLTAMSKGGLYDQLGGGFHRYATERNWGVPHFEKMLSDNALLTRLFLECFQATRQEMYSRIALETLDYLRLEMMSEDGVFYSSQAAHTDGLEGAYHTWEMKEVLALLGPRNAKVFAQAYGMSAGGNFNRRNVPVARASMEAIAERDGIPIFEVQHILNSGKKTLMEARRRRKAPERDDKIVTAWNGLMIQSLALGYAVLQDKSLLDASLKCAEFIWSRQWDGDRLFRVYSQGRSSVQGTLEDYACLVEGFIALYEACFDPVWIERACQIADALIREFHDVADGGFFISSISDDSIPLRLKNAADDAAPSAYSQAVSALARLAAITQKKEYLRLARESVTACGDMIEETPAAFASLLGALDLVEGPVAEIVFTGSADHSEFKKMYAEVFHDFRPCKIVMQAVGDAAAETLPLTLGKSSAQGEPQVYVCQNQTCNAPVDSATALQRLLEPPPEIQINIFDENKHTAEMHTKENENFLGAMSEIFKHSGLGGR